MCSSIGVGGNHSSLPQELSEIKGKHAHVLGRQIRSMFDGSSRRLKGLTPWSAVSIESKNDMHKDSVGLSTTNQMTLAAFRVPVQVCNATGDHCHQESSKDRTRESSPGGSPVPESLQPRILHKRGRKQDRKDERDENDEHSTNRQPKMRKRDDHTPPFACPFFKRDPYHHMECINYKLRRVRDIKQHLQRKHYQPYLYCPTCHQTFSGATDRDSHIQSRRCSPQCPPTLDGLDGVSQEKQELLNTCVDRSAAAFDQWYSIWNTLFPGQDRPSSPYLGNYFQENFGMIRELWGQEGRSIVGELFQVTEEQREEEEFLQDMMLQLLNELQERLEQRVYGASSRQNYGSATDSRDKSFATPDWLFDPNSNENGLSDLSSSSEASELSFPFTFDSSLDIGSPKLGNFDTYQCPDDSLAGLSQSPIFTDAFDFGFQLNDTALFDSCILEQDCQDAS